MRYAIIKDDLVVNIIVADNNFISSSTMLKIEDDNQVDIGYKYNKKTKSFSPPDDFVFEVNGGIS